MIHLSLLLSISFFSWIFLKGAGKGCKRGQKKEEGRSEQIILKKKKSKSFKEKFHFFRFLKLNIVIKVILFMI